MRRYIGQDLEGSCVRVSVPVDLGCATLLAHGCAHQPRSSLNPELWGFLWRLHPLAMIGY